MSYARNRPEQLFLGFAAIYLILATVETAALGAPGLANALTFSGKLTGASLVLVSAVALAGAVAAGYLLTTRRNPRPHQATVRRQRGLLLICLASITVLVANLMILVAQFAVGDPTPALAVWMAFIVASAAVIAVAVARLDTRIPLPRKVAVGALVTGVLAVANFTYSQLYLPSKQEASIIATPVFGTPTKDADQGGVTVPFSVDFTIKGQGVMVLAATYDVSARVASLAREPRSEEQLAKDVQQGNEPSATTNVTGMEPVQAGWLIEPGSPYQAGEELKIDRFIRLPNPLRYDSVELDLYVAFVRSDRATLLSNPDSCSDDLSHCRWDLRQANALYQRIRQPVTIELTRDYQPHQGQFDWTEVTYTPGRDADNRYGVHLKVEHTRLALTNLG
ncbi:hypothetical protein ABZ541_02495 [Micromonospora sediminicola]|uniref:hypothetical protein n=1 Tax=Micromonospora sediminicola TaxID=946078 RepID=UPI0033E57E2E